jgi:hypothetical protein
MSVTFYSECTKTQRTPCDFLGERHEEICGLDCDGTQVVPVAPEFNLTNTNARAILWLTGLSTDEYLYGELACSEIPRMLQRIMVLLATPGALTAAVRETEVEVAESGARLIRFGIDEDYLIDRLERLRALLVYSSKEGVGIHWG